MNKWTGGARREEERMLGPGFGGINMFSEADEADFASAREAGITVVRFGAVGDAQDFRYLMDAEGEHSVVCEHTINRLAAGIQRAADHGIKVIIALGHVPGRIFAQEAEQYDFRLWCSPEYGERFAALWGTLARNLRHFENVVGYDLLNEPFTPDDIAQGYFDEMPSTYVGTLNELYRKAIPAIREWDSETPIILELTYWASPRTLKFLQTYDDERIVYSFHMYAPPAYTMRGLNRCRFAYPGPVRNWPNSKWGDSIYWDKETIRALLGEVRSGRSSTKSRTAISSSANAASAARRPAPSAIFSTCSTSWPNSTGVGRRLPFATPNGTR